MRIIDLTHTVAERMPVYPGTEQPRLSAACTIEKDMFRETLIRIYSHTGTHMDAPSHIFHNGASLDEMPAEAFIGKALVIDCKEAKKCIEMDRIDINKADKADFLLFFTGFDRYWNQVRYFTDYPVCGQSVIDYLINSHKKGIGLDTISADPIGSLENHRSLLKNDVLIVENLTGLGALGSETFDFCALPLKIENADGAPIRAIAMLGGK